MTCLAVYRVIANHHMKQSVTANQVLKQIVQDLPANRDWLNPDLEKIAREITK